MQEENEAFCILHSDFAGGPWSVVRTPSPGFVGALWEPCRRIGVATAWLSTRIEVALVGIAGAVSGLSAFSIQPSALNASPGGGPGAVWYWSGGGLMWISQGSYIK